MFRLHETGCKFHFLDHDTPTPKRFPQIYGRRFGKHSMRIESVFFVVFFGLMVFTGLALADPFDVKEAVEETHCRTLATDYAKAPSSLTIHAIAQLQVCLALTLQHTASPAALPRNFDMQPSRSSTSMGNTPLPTLPTPPTPPKSLKIR